MAHVLVIDDDPLVCESFSHIIGRQGHEVQSAQTIEQGLADIMVGGWDVVFLDVRLPDGDGLELLPRIRDIADAPEVIIVTGYGDPDGAELAIKNGAWDYIEKTSSHKRLTLSLSRALQFREGKRLRKSPVSLKREKIIGDSPRIEACLDRLAMAAGTENNVLITGETGTGKELFAEALHKNSPRTDQPIIVVDCAALPENLTESVLFGHEKGIFTGADRAREGLIKQADGGTLFLDEVGELPLFLQKAFLRVLETKTFRPIGSRREITSHFRLVAATNKNLPRMVEEGCFRNDLLFRLNSVVIELPPLRERIEDIKSLTMYYMQKICERHDAVIKGISPEFFSALSVYDWPGNVRELVHTLETVYVAAEDDVTLLPWHLPNHIRIVAARASVAGSPTRQPARPSESVDPDQLPTWKEFKDSNERRYLELLMDRTRGDIKEACSVSGLGRTRLYELLNKNDIPRQR